MPRCRRIITIIYNIVLSIYNYYSVFHYIISTRYIINNRLNIRVSVLVVWVCFVLRNSNRKRNLRGLRLDNNLWLANTIT